MPTREKLFNQIQTVLLVLFILVTTLSFLHSPGTSDTSYWKTWIKNANDYGVIEGYTANHDDYPPYATVILFSGFKTAHLLNIKVDETDSIKLSIFVFLCLTSLIFWLWTLWQRG